LYFYRLDAPLFSPCQLKNFDGAAGLFMATFLPVCGFLYINAHFATSYQAIALAHIVITIIIIHIPCFITV
jgi:hypothetical protein